LCRAFDREDDVRLRATGLMSALSIRESAVPRTVPRRKRSVGTSHCAGASISYALLSRQRGDYRFERECFCLSPEAHGAQFLDGLLVGWVKGNA
jgi:hypothetical protein